MTEEYFPRGGKKPNVTYFKQSSNVSIDFYCSYYISLDIRFKKIFKLLINFIVLRCSRERTRKEEKAKKKI